MASPDRVRARRARERPSASDFACDGFAVLGEFVAGAELAAVLGDVETLVRQPQDPSCVRPHNTLLPLRWRDPIVRLLMGSVQRVRMVSDAVGADDLRWISGYVSVKDAKSAPLWWHQDWWCWDHPVTYRGAAAQIAVLCYLADTDAGNAALRVLPGSHRRSTAIHAALREAHDIPAEKLDPAHPAFSDHPNQVTVSLRAGEAVVIDYRLLHATHANASDQRRDCTILNFTPSWRTLPTDIKAHLIRHPALPDTSETPASSWATGLLPTFTGKPADLPLNRLPPRRFEVAD